MIERVVKTHLEHPDAVIVPRVSKGRFNPVCFPALFKENLLELEGDEGGRQILEKQSCRKIWVDFEEDKLALDLDSEEDLRRIQNMGLEVIWNDR